MMGEFENYLKRDFEIHKRQQESRENHGELVSARAKITRLQTEVELLTTAAQSARIEYDREREKDKLDILRERETLDNFKRQLEFAVKAEQRTRQDLEESRQRKDLMKQQFEDQVHDLRQQKLTLETTLQDLQICSRGDISRLSNENTKKDVENKMLQNNLEEAKAQLHHQIRRGIEASSNKRAMEEYRMENNLLQQQIKELQQKLREQEDSATIARAVGKDVMRLSNLDAENKKLADENRYFREVNENNALLKEQASSLEAKLIRAEQRNEDMTRIQLDNEEVKAKLRKWECIDLADGNPVTKTPTQLASRIAELQHHQAILLEKQGQYMTSSHSHEQALKNTREDLILCNQKMLVLEEEKKKQDEMIKRLQKRLILLTKERDSMKQINKSYDTEVSMKSGYQTQQNARLRQAEDNLQTCQKQMEAMETDVKVSKEEASQCRLQVRQLEARVYHLQEELSHCKNNPEPTPYKTPDDPDPGRILKARIEELEQEIGTLSERNELLEARFEQRSLQGDYDPTKTKVISFSMNPANVARQARAAELANLREESETLRQRVKVLEESGASTEDVTMQVAKKLKQSGPSSQEVEDLKKEVKANELRNQRLKEVFAKKIQEFREACYRLTGYQINNPADNQYNLMSMYAESSTDALLFQTTPNGEMQLLQNEFSSTLTDYIESFLQQQHSIPAFLSSVTLDLFSRQTMS